MAKTLLVALRMLLVLTALTGVVYPLAVTVLAWAGFRQGAGGSLVRRHGQVVGSELLAQRFVSDRYIWSRPSAADYATVPSGASNAGPTSAVLRQTVDRRAAALRAAHGLTGSAPLPADLLYASGSGLDPHVSPAAARLQVNRVAAARGLEPGVVTALVEGAVEMPQWGFLGEPRVNVLQVNLALDRL